MTTTATTTTISTTTTTTRRKQKQEAATRMTNTALAAPSVARVEDLGKQAAIDSNTRATRQSLANTRRARQIIINDTQREQEDGSRSHHYQRQQQQQLNSIGGGGDIGGNDRVTTISTIAAQSGQSRIVLAILRDGTELQLKVQEMRPSIFEVGADYKECSKYLQEHQKLVQNLHNQNGAPIECWLAKYNKISSGQNMMALERKLVYMCMLENLQACWKGLLSQLEWRFALLREVCEFYGSAEKFAQALDRADKHVQVFREDFFAGPGSVRFARTCDELKSLNDLTLTSYQQARGRQQELMDSIRVLGTNNLGDSRANQLISGAQDLINYIGGYLDPLDRRRIKLEKVIETTKTTSFSSNKQLSAAAAAASGPVGKKFAQDSMRNEDSSSSFLREISNFNDLNLVDNWLNIKIDQLNSSLLSSLGLSVSDSRSILDKHEQIALECRAIEEASLTFDGRSIHAIKSISPKDDQFRGDVSLFGQQKLLSQRARNVLTILEARLALLRRTIDFYLRAKEATVDVNRMLRRLQVDNSLQSVQFVSNELELKDVSSVVASGATIMIELQQLQLAQQHGHRSRIVNLNLVTTGVRSIIDQLSQELAHLKTALNQRKLVLLNEDATKMANNFSNKCHQLQFWLANHVRSFLLAEASSQVAANGLDVGQLRSQCDQHEQLRVAVQSKTLEVEALLRSLPTTLGGGGGGSGDDGSGAKSNTLEKIQRETDELRHNWIQATNCLDRRLDLLRKYLAIVNTVTVLEREFESLVGFGGGSSSKQISPDRTAADIRSNIEQSLVQLANQVRNFTMDAQKSTTSLDEDPDAGATGSSSDMNKQQMVDYANELLRILTDKKQAALGTPDDGDGADGGDGSRKRREEEQQPAHQRPQQLDPPRFTRALGDQMAEPFSTVELECETDQVTCQVEWFMNNFKRIPQNIRYSSSSEGNRHRLTIHNFSPVCCGTFMARAWNGSGQAVSQCRLRLAGIEESQDEPAAAAAAGGGGGNNNNREAPRVANPSASLWRQHNGTTTTITQQHQSAQSSSSPAISTTSSFSQWRPTEPTTTSATRSIEDQTASMSRIIQGVDGGSSRQSESPNPMAMSRMNEIDSKQTSRNEATTTIGFPESSTHTTVTTTATATTDRDSLWQTANSASSSNSHRIELNANTNYHVESPVSSATLTRSMSKSPFAGSPLEPPSRSCSRSSLVCMIVGNPPPSIEWKHNNQTIVTTTTTAAASCPRNGTPVNNIGGCLRKVVIETTNPRPIGHQFVRQPQISLEKL